MIRATDAQTNSISARRRQTPTDAVTWLATGLADASCFEFLEGATSPSPLLRRISITDKLGAARQPGHIAGCLQFNELLAVQLLSTALARCLHHCLAF